MNINLSDHFSFNKILRFTISPILMMVFTSLYGIVDGYFISNYAGNDAYAGVNLIMPVVMIIGGLGFMFGTGGSALTGMYLGKKEQDNANNSFTMIMGSILILGIIISIFGFAFIRPIAEAMGRITKDSTKEMIEEAITYGRILCAFQFLFMLQTAFQNYLVVDEKPKLGFTCTLYAGITNMVFDFLFIGVFKWGVIGAAIATIMGYAVGSIIPFIHFIKNKNGTIRFSKTKVNFKMIGKACFNGSSEFVNNISMSIVGLVYNIQLLKYFGQDGVSAYGTIMYISFLFISVAIGYSIGMAPVISYNYGAKNKKEMQNVLSKSFIILTICSIFMFVLAETVGPIFAKLYVGDYPDLLKITNQAFKINGFQFLFANFAIYLSSFFTALNNGLISAIISFLRTLVFQIFFVIFLPLIFNKDMIWYSTVFAEFLSLIISLIFLITNSTKYGYFKKNNLEI